MRCIVYEAIVKNISEFKLAFQNSEGSIGLAFLEFPDSDWDVYFFVPDLRYTNMIQFVVFFSDDLELEINHIYTLSFRKRLKTEIEVVNVYKDLLLRSDGMVCEYICDTAHTDDNIIPLKGACFLELDSGERIMFSYNQIELYKLKLYPMLSNVDYSSVIRSGNEYKITVFVEDGTKSVNVKVSETISLVRENPVRIGTLAVF